MFQSLSLSLLFTDEFYFHAAQYGYHDFRQMIPRFLAADFCLIDDTGQVEAALKNTLFTEWIPAAAHSLVTQTASRRYFPNIPQFIMSSPERQNTGGQKRHSHQSYCRIAAKATTTTSSGYGYHMQRRTGIFFVEPGEWLFDFDIIRIVRR